MKRLLFTTVLLNGLFLALLLPHYPWMPWVAAEALLLCGLFALLPSGVAKHAGAVTVGSLYGLLAFFSLSDLLVRESIGRPFNLYLEFDVAGSVFDLMQSNLGTALSVILIVMILATFVGLAVCVGRLLKQVGPSVSRRTATATTTLGLVALVVASLPQPFVGLSAARTAAHQVELAVDTHRSTASFRQHLEDNPGAGQSRPLQKLGETDVILGFIESYGISSVTDPRYGPLIRPRLAQMEQTLADAGLHIVTGRLRSPVQGGQSWLAHTTLLSGQWIDTQLDYEIFLASDYPTLIDDLANTGHDTVAVMPAITRDWPEGRAFGYNRIYESSTMDYRGPALNWVTMPDQYTWSWFQRQVRDRAEKPVFAEVALISSHAPWVPVLPVLDDWDSIGDGEAFNRWKDAGESPASLWKNPERVREHYARSVDYALNVATEYAKRHVDNKTLLVLTGDHQAAPLITGDDAGRDVIVHVISADPGLLAPFVGNHTSPDGLHGFQWGAHPQNDLEGPAMARFRPFLHRHFSLPSLSAKISSDPIEK